MDKKRTTCYFFSNFTPKVLIQNLNMKTSMNTIRIVVLLCMVVFGASGYASMPIIDPSLRSEMNKRGDDEKIKVNILMTEQSDFVRLEKEAGFFGAKRERRDYVVATLKQQAEASQAELLNQLKAMEMVGMVEDIRPLWIVNSISCLANKEAIIDLAQRCDIMTIYYVDRVPMISEYELIPAPNGPSREITPNLLKVKAPEVWEQGYTGQGVLIALIDTGVRLDHADLEGRLWDGGPEYPHHGYDFASHNDNPFDALGHGTHVAGILCGTGVSGTQTGIAPGATIMVLKVFHDDNTCEETDYVAAMQFAVEHGADVLNMSLGRPLPNEAQKLMSRKACENTLAAGLVAGVSAGNVRQIQYLIPIPNNITLPAQCPPPYLHEDQMVNPGGRSCVISVGALNDDNTIAAFSSEGPSQWTDVPDFGDYPYASESTNEIGLIRPDLCAPGVQIKSLDYNSPTGYAFLDGTSMATPLVTGTIALMLSKNKELTPEIIDEVLECTAVKLSEHKSNDFGSGLLDAWAAVQAIDYDAVNDQQQEMLVYPNPSIGDFTVTCQGLKEINVFSLDGKLVQHLETTNDTEQIQGLKAGIYVLQIMKENTVSYHKILKIK